MCIVHGRHAQHFCEWRMHKNRFERWKFHSKNASRYFLSQQQRKKNIWAAKTLLESIIDETFISQNSKLRILKLKTNENIFISVLSGEWRERRGKRFHYSVNGICCDCGRRHSLSNVLSVNGNYLNIYRLLFLSSNVYVFFIHVINIFSAVVIIVGVLKIDKLSSVLKWIYFPNSLSIDKSSHNSFDSDWIFIISVISYKIPYIRFLLSLLDIQFAFSFHSHSATIWSLSSSTSKLKFEKLS